MNHHIVSPFVSLLIFVFTVIGGSTLSVSGCPTILLMLFAISCCWLLVMHTVSEGKWIFSLLKKFKRNPNIPPPPFSKMITVYPFPLTPNEPRNEVSIIEED